jgi:hypothetical protein
MCLKATEGELIIRTCTEIKIEIRNWRVQARQMFCSPVGRNEWARGICCLFHQGLSYRRHRYYTPPETSAPTHQGTSCHTSKYRCPNIHCRYNFRFHIKVKIKTVIPLIVTFFSTRFMYLLFVLVITWRESVLNDRSCHHNKIMIFI